MRQHRRLSRMLPVRLHMARFDGPATSGTIARMLGTNPMVVRRTMAGLREAEDLLIRRLGAVSLAELAAAFDAGCRAAAPAAGAVCDATPDLAP